MRPIPPLTKAEIQRLRSLQDKKHRDALGLFAVEGEKAVGDLAAAGFAFEEIYATGAWTRPRTREISEADMARASHFPTPSAVLAVGRIKRQPLPPRGLDRGITLALDGVQDPGNVGTLLRIADWFAVDRVLLSPDCADPYSQKTINASMGSFARVVVHTAELPAALAECRAPVWGCGLDGEDVHSAPPPRDAVIVIGSEGRGLSEGVSKVLARTITIPRRGGAESLNAAVAAGIVCDVLLRNRCAKKGGADGPSDA